MVQSTLDSRIPIEANKVSLLVFAGRLDTLTTTGGHWCLICAGYWDLRGSLLYPDAHSEAILARGWFTPVRRSLSLRHHRPSFHQHATPVRLSRRNSARTGPIAVGQNTVRDPGNF